MAKRSRLAGRPGQRRPLQRTAGRPAATTAPATVTRPASSVTPEEEARAADEYRYVQRDVRRIAIVGGLLLLILAILDVLVNGMHLFTL